MELFPSNKSLAWSRKTFAITLAMALALIFAVNRSALADTFWSNTAPTSVSDLMPGEYWTNGAPTSTNNSGYITGKTLTVTSDFKPGADGQDVDLTFGQGSDVTMNNAFIPLANLDSGQKGTVTFQLTGNANLYVGGNFWGGIDNDSREYSLNEDEYLLNQYYGGDSTFSSNEWWSAMSVKTYMKISDNAAVIARGGNSGLGWDDSAYGSKLELTDHGALTVNSTNMSIWGKDTTVNMYDHSTFSANTMNVSNQTPQINLYGNSKLTVHNTLTLDDKAAVSVNGNATLTVANDCSFDKNGSMTVNDNAEAYFNRYLRIGYSNNGEKGGAVFTQTGGTVTVSFDTYFSFHSDATINLAGGQFICHSSETYVTDQKDCKADINMSGDGYLQVNDLRLSQHGHTTLIMEDNSQIKASKVVNVAFNFSDEDHVVNKNTLNDSANITSNSMVFFGNNIDSSAYASITLNDDSTIAIANDVKVGLGSTTSPLGDNDYAAEITLNNNSKFSTKTFTTTVGAKSATTVNGSAIFEAETITIADGSFLNVNGGTVNVTSLINEGTVNLKGGAITLTPYGLITSTAGTFKATSGAVNVTVPAGVTYTDGDQMIVGFFGDDATASAVSGQTVVPEDWQKSVISMGESKKAVVASYGDTVPTSVKIWTGNAGAGDTSEGNPDNWLSDAGNPTGYVLEGTNAISGISGKTVFLGGDNTLSGDTPYDATLSINGGTVQYNNAIVRGNLLMNGGTFTDIGELRIGDLTEVKNGDNTEYVNYPAVFTQTDGVFTATATTFFSFHADATVNLSGGQCIIQGGQLYVTDQRGCTGDISMTNDSYLQAKDLRLSQHGMTTLTMEDNSHLSVSTFNLGYNYNDGDNVESIVTMSGNSKLDVNGNFVAFQGNNDQNHSGAAYASFTMSDNAYAYVDGDTWGGSNDGTNVPGLILENSDNQEHYKDYNLEMTFKDNSYFSTGEFWMAMAGITHVTIQDNATVISRKGNAGLGWCDKTDGSLLEITGGTLQVIAVDGDGFSVGNDSNNQGTGRANVQQTGGTAYYKALLIRHSESGYYISGDKSVMTSGSISTVSDSILSVSGGTVNVGAGGISGEGTIDLSVGTVTSGSDDLPEAQRGSWTSSANATLTGTKTADADTRITFAPAADTSITWNSVLSGDGGLIVNGAGTFALAAPSAYAGLTSVESGTFEIALADSATTVTIASIEMAAKTAFKVTSGTVEFGEDSVTLNNLSGGSLNENVSATINAAEKNLTLTNDQPSKYIGSISAKTIKKDGNDLLQLYADANGLGIRAESFVISSGRLDMKEFFTGTLEIQDGASFSPGNSVGSLTINTFENGEYGEFILNEGGKLIIEQDATGIDTLSAKSFKIDPNATLEITMGNAIPGATYPIIFNLSGEDFGVVDDIDYSDPAFWNGLLDAKSDFFWNLDVVGNVVYASIDANAVPEPSTWALLALGIAGLLYWRKKNA